MNSVQKIIKYFAIAFAATLSISIIAGIVFGGLGILTATKLIKDNSSVEISCEESDKACLQISLAASELIIKKGDNLSAESTYDKVEIKQDGDQLVITENGGSIFGNYDRTTTVYVPENMEFDKVGISGGAGRIYVETLKAKEMEVSLGIGETVFGNLEVDQAKISTGIGHVEINLASSDDAYAIKVDRGIGEVKFNGSRISSDTWIGNGDKKIEISGGIGELDIKTAAKKAE
ncbi:DUF4097 family beta strand repeat protein [Candidatus Saccharibacteria bacterium]|nr:DUF4097 family beta strand repeat protein [Candidatus Saccharibacteria bacterium]